MLQQVVHDKEDHECQGNQNQPSYGKLPHDKEDKEDKEGRERQSNENRPGHGKLLCGGGDLNVVLDQYFADLWRSNHFNATLTLLEQLSRKWECVVDTMVRTIRR